MKNIKNLFQTCFLLLAIATVTIACQDDEYDPPGFFVDLNLTVSTGSTPIRIGEVNRFTSFSDISAGADYSEWIIPSTAFFLQGPIPNNLENYDDYIINPGETVSSDKTVHVLFTKGDSFTPIKYRGIFPDSTSHTLNVWNPETGEGEVDTIKTERVNGKWVAEFTFIYDVYDTVVAKPEVRFLDETILDYENTPALTLSFGDKLIVEDLSAFILDNNARPEYTRFRVHTTEEDEDNQTNMYSETFQRDGDFERRIIDTITFDEVGEFRIEHTARRERGERVGQSEDILDIPTLITVIPLDEDLELDTSISVEERDDDRIFIPITSRLAEIEGDVTGNFDVQVDGASIPVSTVGIGARNGGDAGFIILTLETPLVPADAAKTVTVSYDGNGDLMSRDLRPLQAFSNADIQVYVPIPVALDGTLITTIDGKITIPFDQPLSSESIANSLDPTAGFIIGLNGGSGTVSSVAISATDDKVLELELVEGVYDDDVITVAYTGPGDIRSVGDGEINDFTAQPVEIGFFNILADAVSGFDNPINTDWRSNSKTGGEMEIVPTPTPLNPSSVTSTGNALRMASANGANERPRALTVVTVPFEDGVAYKFRYKRYLVAANTTVVAGQGDLFRVSFNTTVNNWDDAGTVFDTWQEFEAIITPGPEGILDFRTVQGSPHEVYYDDLMIDKYETRP
ncbi:SwmB domain-containing protein [Seonamhaeicola sp.]|uniref:SwmB domain-containing protein n=1 Tax=Seonamhaeicola sp. TaxID=1912245 RepID=UPI00261B5C51|nr:SwmB domain-containing protein [Seonamhaeicola sp.]